jgi:hypothetical protein
MGLLSGSNTLVRKDNEGVIDFKKRWFAYKMQQDIESAQTVDDLKALLLRWMDNGTLQARIPPPWDKK